METTAEVIEAARQCQRLGDLRQAEQLFGQAVSAEAGRADLWSDLGKVCQRQKKTLEAAHAYERAIQLEPDHADWLLAWGSHFPKLTVCRRRWRPTAVQLP